MNEQVLSYQVNTHSWTIKETLHRQCLFKNAEIELVITLNTLASCTEKHRKIDHFNIPGYKFITFYHHFNLEIWPKDLLLKY